MKCYFHGANRSKGGRNRDNGIISFAIPDIGVVYRTKCTGDRLECEYLALAALLEFLDSNSEIMTAQNLELLGDSAVVIYQLNGKMPVFSRLVSLFNRVEGYKSKFEFRILWTPASLNRAAMALPDLPPLKPSIRFDFSFALRKPNRPTNPSSHRNGTKLW